MPDGLQSGCKACMNVSYKKSRNKKLDHYNSVQHTRVQSAVDQMRLYKTERGCLVCRETYAQCLEMHHTNPAEKEIDPSAAVGYGWKRFLAEAEKCIVLCANCHRKVHGGVIDLRQYMITPGFA